MRPTLMQASTYKVVMIVESVSPTPFALLRRGNHFQYREESLQHFSEYEDPVTALTEECRRVLRAVAAANQTQAVSSAKHSTGLRDASWSRFEDIGFGGTLEDDDDDDFLSSPQPKPITGLKTTPSSGRPGGRPTTPSWADFLSSGFVDERAGSPTNLLPPDQQLPPIDAQVRQRSAQSHRPRLEGQRDVEQGELASIVKVNLDDSFWWVWMMSLAPEETPDRKAAFGRCAVIETIIRNGRWLVFEEVIKGAAPEPQEGAYVAQKKSFFSWRRKEKDKNGVIRRKSTNGKKSADKHEGGLKSSATTGGISKSSLGPDQQARIQAAAQQLQAKQERERALNNGVAVRRGRTDAELMAEKTQSVMTLQPMIMKEASPAMKWANRYDKDTIREAYLANGMAGRGEGQQPDRGRGLGQATMQSNGLLGHGIYEEPESSPSLRPSPSLRSTAEDRRAEMTSPAPASPEDRRSAMASPSPASPERGRLTPAPRGSEAHSMEIRRNEMISPVPAEGDSPKQNKKLHKGEKKNGGFRKLFGRGRRTSKVPDEAPDFGPAPLRADTPQQMSSGPQTPQPVPSPVARNPVNFASPEQALVNDAEPTHNPSNHSNSFHEAESRIGTADAEQADQEFSRFDQGPLDDQPAFTPENDEEEDATPSPIRQIQSVPQEPEPEPEAAPEAAPEATTEAAPEAAPEPAPERRKPRGRPPRLPVAPSGPQTAPAIERWAQIRKNAASRAQQQKQPEREPEPAPKLDVGGEECKSSPAEHDLSCTVANIPTQPLNPALRVSRPAWLS